jgi:hypothetical protein
MTVLRSHEQIALDSKCGFALQKDDPLVVHTAGGGATALLPSGPRRCD